jgi:hypothetical protein
MKELLINLELKELELSYSHNSKIKLTLLEIIEELKKLKAMLHPDYKMSMLLLILLKPDQSPDQLYWLEEKMKDLFQVNLKTEKKLKELCQPELPDQLFKETPTDLVI